MWLIFMLVWMHKHTRSDWPALRQNVRPIQSNLSAGYAIYEVLGNSERSLVAEEKVADVMSKWEKYRNANASSANTLNNKPVRKQHHFFLFKKHLFLDQYMDLNDPVEKELLYHQVLHSLRTDRFPITEDEAVCSLHQSRDSYCRKHIR